MLIDDIDEWIIDIKDMNTDIYTKYTGKSNNIVICNLKMVLPHLFVIYPEKGHFRRKKLLYAEEP